MYEITKKNIEKSKYFIFFSFVIVSLILVAAVYKNDEVVNRKEKSVYYEHPDLKIVKEFFLKKIQSPFIDENYQIKSGDSIQKILKNFKIKNNEIQTVIEKFKKYSNPNKLLVNNKIKIIVEKNLSGKDNSISLFSVPITPSTTIEIKKDEFGKITSEKIITKLYKKRVVAENIIKQNLYSAAINAKINPETIIEFARIFGFEIDFQRDIRENDYFKIIYEKYSDENGEFIKSGSILYAHMTVNNREITLYKFGNDKDYGYFDINGKSVEKALMKTPINGARLSGLLFWLNGVGVAEIV